MAIKITLSNSLPAVSASLAPALSKVVRSTAAEIESSAKLSLSGSKSGRVYLRRGISHQASAPGEAPSTDTGMLANSINTTNDGALTAIVGVGAEYAEPLEYGTTRMGPRPFLTPAAEAARPGFNKAVADVLK